jgi:hypothetical protein
MVTEYISMLGLSSGRRWSSLDRQIDARLAHSRPAPFRPGCPRADDHERRGITGFQPITRGLVGGARVMANASQAPRLFQSGIGAKRQSGSSKCHPASAGLSVHANCTCMESESEDGGAAPSSTCCTVRHRWVGHRLNVNGLCSEQG